MTSKSFTVSHGGIRLRVSLRPTVRDVHRAYQACHNGAGRRDGMQVHAFFYPTLSLSAKHVGGVVLPESGGELNELVPHEVAHAVIHAHGGVLPHDDEDTATAIGVLTARIFRRINRIRGGYDSPEDPRHAGWPRCTASVGFRRPDQGQRPVARHAEHDPAADV
jgi:hypothetical protein